MESDKGRRKVFWLTFQLVGKRTRVGPLKPGLGICMQVTRHRILYILRTEVKVSPQFGTARVHIDAQDSSLAPRLVPSDGQVS
ncbi:hypothetical protein BHM03_00054813 [Ensete ventricosum]|nr:hypothetical protein BHM03_00054813 [Ensete ventricosum]